MTSNAHMQEHDDYYLVIRFRKFHIRETQKSHQNETFESGKKLQRLTNESRSDMIFHI